jgi:hypothetical protein
VGLLSLKIFDSLTLTPLDQADIYREHRITTLSTHHSCMFTANPFCGFSLPPHSSLYTLSCLVTRPLNSTVEHRECCSSPASLVQRVFHLLATTYVHRSGSLYRRPRLTNPTDSNTSHFKSVLSIRGFLWLGLACSCATVVHSFCLATLCSTAHVN